MFTNDRARMLHALRFAAATHRDRADLRHVADVVEAMTREEFVTIASRVGGVFHVDSTGTAFTDGLPAFA